MVVASQQPQSASQSEIPTPQELREQVQAVQLPPSERDFEVFDELVVKRLSTRQVAARHGVSQTRIVQIHRKVALWMATLPSEPELTPVQQIRLATEIVSMRIDNLYGEAMQGWHASRQSQGECRGSETRTVRSQHGDPRYLAVATRIIERQLHLVVFGQTALAKAKSREQKEQRDERSTNPLDGDCSIPLGSKEAWEQTGANKYAASDWEPGTYDPNDPACRAFDEDLAKFGDTVQLAASDVARLQATGQQASDEQAADEEFEELETLPEEPAVAPSPVAAPRRLLNRKERRRRERLLRRAKRKAK